MSKTFRMVLILLVVVSISSAALAVFTFVGKEREYMKRILLEDKLEATLKDKKRLEKELNSTKREKKEIEVKITKMEAGVRELSSQIEEVKDKNKSMTMDLATKKKEIAKLKGSLENEKKEKFNISKKLEDLQFDYEKAERDFSRLKNEKIRLEKKLSDLKQRSVDLDTIVVGPSAESISPESVKPTRKPLRGRVLVVNRDYSFVVTDLGQDDGIEKGMMFEIRDDTKLLGSAEIDKVYDTMSSATVLPGGKINSMKKGNLIIESR